MYVSTWSCDIKNMSCGTAVDASGITRALCGPWPQRGVEFVARECCEHSFAAENVADCCKESVLARRTTA